LRRSFLSELSATSPQGRQLLVAERVRFRLTRAVFGNQAAFGVVDTFGYGDDALPVSL
jgi:hypothetical protein